MPRTTRPKGSGAKHFPGMTQEAWEATATKASQTTGSQREALTRVAMKMGMAARQTRGFKPTGTPSRRK